MAFEELKAKHKKVWGSGPYQGVSDHLAGAHDHLMREVEPREGERWLDVATGTGEIAIRAAKGGASVTGLDLAPELLETARERASEAGAEVDFDEGDAENMPYEDGSFDTVSSTFGVMFAPDHAAAAAELGRVTKPGGRLALLDLASDQGRRGVLQGHGRLSAAAARGRRQPLHLGRSRPPRGAARRRVRAALRGGRRAADRELG